MVKSKLKRVSSKPSKTLRKRAVKTFNDWIKARDGYKCVTCKKQMKKGDIDCQAGHFIHGDSLDFDERNMNCQCGFVCNKSKKGNPIEYTLFMVKKYGIDTVHELQRLKREVRKFSKEELENIISRYGGSTNERLNPQD